MNNLSVNGSSNGLFAKPTIGRSEYGRVKVALAPGKGFMDWLRLTTNKHLAKRVSGGVDHVELMKHNTKDDCWVHLFGIVYDVTKYLDFHPGGIPELLRGAGRDATPLFNQYHAWVNYESMLKACVVGPFIGDLTKCEVPSPLPPTTSDDKNKLGVPSSALFSTDPSENGYGARVETLSDNSGISFEHDDWTELTEHNVIVSLVPVFVKTSINTRGEENTEEHARLRVLIHHFWKPAMEFEFEPTPALCHVEYTLKIMKNRVEIRFSREISGGKIDRSKCKIQRRPGVTYHTTEIIDRYRLNHDTLIFSLQLPEHTTYRIPIGHHVSIKIRKGNSVLYRPYTPISNPDPQKIDFMIKIYSNGICTPSLENLKIGGELEISDPIGERNFAEWTENAQELILLAAGSGITPMIDIMEKRIQKTENSNSKVYFLMFNKTENDLQTGKPEENPKSTWKMADFYSKYRGDERIVMKNVLSASECPVETGEYFNGRVSTDLLNSIISTSSTASRRAFICGPDGFILAAKTALESLNLHSDQIHIFQG
ncbi:Cytochrome-b5 reductase [Caenorhabditis elegans]|uniref:Cytochrome-b5 reductase n=1 Tax=Caenorhabditis elegans TaxID=6239 RepID=A0A7R9SUJ3_CAEEL|nr:cytochrome-b5 reductase [Caenorhabditis elegans]CAD8108854.1 cytochrome-b5 reductase [Caenorhabditis elegans]